MSDARAEAERRWPILTGQDAETIRNNTYHGYYRQAFIAGAQYIEETRVKPLEAALAKAIDSLVSIDPLPSETTLNNWCELIDKAPVAYLND